MKRVGFFGDGPWSHNSLIKLLSRKDLEISFVVPRSDVPDEKLISIAKEANIPTLLNMRVNTEEGFKTIASYSCDLLISMSFNQIIKKKLIDLAPLGFINCHAGALPRYRGRNILNWALINDEKEFGITVHYIDEGIDTGDIIVQKMFSISDEDNYSTLLNRSFEHCPQLLDEAVTKVLAGGFDPIKQSTLENGFYCGMRKEGDEYVDWNQSSRRLFNFIRAISEPGIVARSFFDGQEVKIFEAVDLANYPVNIGTPGQIIGKNESGLIVKAVDKAILIKKITNSKDEDLISKLRIGSRFVNYQDYLLDKMLRK